MNFENRLTFILKEIDLRGSASVFTLAQQLEVSEMTIRRDLNDLEREGLVRRVYGGAVSARGRGYEPALIIRAREHAEAKRAIGERAARLVADGDSIALDVGSTTFELARSLLGRHNLTVITPSLEIANLLHTQPDIHLIVSGGIVRPGEASMIGDLAQRAFEGLFLDRLFLGVGAVDSQAGLTEYNWDDALVKKAMIRSSKEVILLSDSSKFEKVAFTGVAPLSALHQLVTDQAPPPNLMEALKKNAVVVHLIGDEETDNQITKFEEI
jgi:DeoR family transcriptional regulator, fructose operon transcriptional repressor